MENVLAELLAQSPIAAAYLISLVIWLRHVETRDRRFAEAIDRNTAALDALRTSLTLLARPSG